MTHPTLMKYYSRKYKTVTTTNYVPMILSIIGIAIVVIAAL
ncbi:MAG: hypothetical protein AAF902_19010 [Chloroflexota bacterium]